MRNVFRKLYRMWRGMGDTLHEVTLAVTFLSLLPVAVYVFYYLFWDFDITRVLAGAVVFRVMVKSNIEM